MDKGTPWQVQVWDVETGQKVGRPLVHGSSISQLRFSPDGSRLVTVSTDAYLRLWDAKSGTKILERKEHSYEIFGGIRWSPDGSRWVTASGDWTAKLWDASKGEVLATFQHDEEVNWAGWASFVHSLRAAACPCSCFAPRSEPLEFTPMHVRARHGSCIIGVRTHGLG